MAPTTTIARTLTAATMFGLLLTGSGAALAVPDPGPPRPSGHSSQCPLERVDSQLVRCDALTGAGVPAPVWVPERQAR
jgi:hypothetical protein